MKLAVSGTRLSDFRLFVRSNIPGPPVHSLLTASHTKPAQTSTVPRWVMTEFQPSGPFATLEPSTAVDPNQDLQPSRAGPLHVPNADLAPVGPADQRDEKAASSDWPRSANGQRNSSSRCVGEGQRHRSLVKYEQRRCWPRSGTRGHSRQQLTPT